MPLAGVRVTPQQRDLSALPGHLLEGDMKT